MLASRKGVNSQLAAWNSASTQWAVKVIESDLYILEID